MKICLINPKYQDGQRAHRIPLGLSYVASILLKEGHEVKGYNLDVDQEPVYSTFDVVGIYVSTPMIKEAKRLISNIIKLHIPIILGGPHISASEDLLEGYQVIGIKGEGEYAFPKALKKLREGMISGMVREPVPDLNALPHPAKRVFDHGNYKNKSFAYGAIVASRGCPFNCKNCQPGLKKISPYRVRKPELVVAEMEELYYMNQVKDFSFEDSELIISKQWTLRFCDELIKKFEGKNITFQGNARLHQLDDEVLSRLKKAGCRRLGVGIESGSQRVLDNCLNKDINLGKDILNLNKIRNHGIESQVWIMIGIPGETEEDIRQTIELTKNLNVSTVEINIATPWPGTYFYDEAKKLGWLMEGEYDEKRKSYFLTPYLTPQRVEELFEEFKEEMQKAGWIKWSHETNTFAKDPSTWTVLKLALKKFNRGDICKEDFRIFKNWIGGRK